MVQGRCQPCLQRGSTDQTSSRATANPQTSTMPPPPVPPLDKLSTAESWKRHDDKLLKYQEASRAMASAGIIRRSSSTGPLLRNTNTRSEAWGETPFRATASYKELTARVLTEPRGDPPSVARWHESRGDPPSET